MTIQHTVAKPDNFSYKTVATDVTVTIPQYQQMSVYQDITIMADGELVISADAELVVYF